MHWNHRVIRNPKLPWFGYGIHEVYYTAKGNPSMATEQPVALFGDSIAELKETLTRMLRCLDQPTLEYHGTKLREAKKPIKKRKK